MKKELSIGQRKAASEILGNMAVAWFSAGVISPLLVKPESIIKGAFLMIVGLLSTTLFTFISLYLVKGVQS